MTELGIGYQTSIQTYVTEPVLLMSDNHRTCTYICRYAQKIRVVLCKLWRQCHTFN